MTKFFFGIPAKTALIFFGVFVVIILPVNYIIYSKVKFILIETDTKDLVAEGEKLFNQVRLDPQVIPLPSLGYSIFLRTTNHTETDSLFASPGFPTEVIDFENQKPVEVDTLKIITLTRPLEYGSGLLNFSIGRSNFRLQSQIKELKIYLFLANIFSILVAGFLVYFVSRYTLKPVRKIISAAERINASNSIDRVPVPNSSDETTQLAITINSMLARIENSIQNQTNFFASAAHELRTPLAVMKAELTLVSEEKRWHEMLKEVERLESTVNDFLMISQLKSQSLTIRKKNAEINELLFSALKKVKYLIREKQSVTQIVLQEQKNEIFISVDEDKLETVLVNLLENAIRYSPEKSTIQIFIRGDVEVSLEIRNPIAQRIDEPEKFKQEFVKTESLSSGLGMGVWIADQIVLLHGGSLDLKSEELFFSAILRFRS
ncbi:hypothetical protein WSM22_08530 [Cytophagales bacterium WSM2-2]|nr:hypothetical protein WSM22_08530 [Cytophagales bacterium WSM2-2]